MSRLQKKIAGWQKSPAKRKEDGVFIAEGLKMFGELPADRVRAVAASVGFQKEHGAELRQVLRKLPAGCEVEYLPDEAFRKLSDTKTPQGILAVLSMYDYCEEEILKVPDGLFIFLEALQDPGNLGTILRSGEAAGVDGILMTPDCVDVYNPKVIRASMGAVFRMKFAVSEDPDRMLRRFHEAGGRSYAACLREDSEDYTKKDFRRSVMFMIGNESAGLTEERIRTASGRIIIPMAGQVESLNAAMASAVLMFEAARQRRS